MIANYPVVLESAEDLDRSAIQELMARALERARTPLDGRGVGRIVIKSLSARQRPRRPPE